MQNQMQVFENSEFGKIRSIQIDGVPWFVLRDACMILGLSSPHKVADRLDEDEKGRSLIPTLGGVQEMAVINESGLYAVILRSDKPNAKSFRKWITSEVLPSIRKHRAYINEDVIRRMQEDIEFNAELLRNLTAERNKNNSLMNRVAQLAPKAHYHDIILQCTDAVQVSIIAKDYAMSAVAFNKLLYKLKVQYRIGDTWLLYQNHANKGYTVTRTYHVSNKCVRIHTYWTQSGRRFLYEILKWHGILPEAERPGGAFVGGDNYLC
jgi:prophage antirepressor-like protein